MADQITGLRTIKDADDNILDHRVSYDLEKSGHHLTIEVTINAAEMTNPASDVEIKALANALALEIKDAWDPTDVIEVENSSSLNGNVTL